MLITTRPATPAEKTAAKAIAAKASAVKAAQERGPLFAAMAALGIFAK